MFRNRNARAMAGRRKGCLMKGELYSCFICSGMKVSIGSGIGCIETDVKDEASGVLNLVQDMLAMEWVNILECESDES